MNRIESISVLIPAFNPNEKLMLMIDELIGVGYKHIIIVNDGSDQKFKWVFDAVSLREGCHILVHSTNLGKGRALKKGFEYFLNNVKECVGIVTADADGQHSIQDIVRVSQELIDKPNRIILGSRNFSQLDIPYRSKFGNVLTKKLFSSLSGIKISDTQTGLRGIPHEFIRSLLSVNGERYEYEMNMLFECKLQNIPIDEVAIDTIYIDDNSSSHFDPLIDSIKIYSVFLKYISSSVLSFFIDIFIFSICTKILNKITPEYFIISSTICARIFSSFVNYTVNKKRVFKKESDVKVSFIKYYILCVTQMILSGLAVSVIWSMLRYPEVVVKVIVDSILFVISFQVQKEWVFKEK